MEPIFGDGSHTVRPPCCTPYHWRFSTWLLIWYVYRLLHLLQFSLIQMLIIYQLPWHAVRSMSQASTGLRVVLIPRVYESVRFGAGSEWALNDLNIGAFFRKHGSPQTAQLLQHARRVVVEAPIQIARFHRCMYHTTPRLAPVSHGQSFLGSPPEPTAHESFMADLSAQLGQIFALFKTDTLHSFWCGLTLLAFMHTNGDSWHLATCMPTGILDSNGYLIQHQRDIKRVSLMTDGTCPHAGQGFGGLSTLTSLSEIMWEGIRHRWEIEILRECLRQNQSHLRKLQIGCLLSGADHHLTVPELTQPWPELSHQPYPPNPFSSLSSLSLSNVHFPSELLASTRTLSFQSLQELRLLQCDNQLHFLWLLAQMGSPPPLKWLEINSDLFHESDNRLVYIAIVELLLSFRGLQHLHIKLANFPRFLPGFQEAILHHRSSLRSLSFHERQLIAVDEEGLFEDIRDVSPRWTRDIPQVLQHCSLTALGLCLTPLIAVSTTPCVKAIPLTRAA